ncbi:MULTISPECIES: GntR family transcriptional regulator [Bhargavaea]|uniref:GntR family transcriptional regulator n=1 Tax=Bhargavaea changchunensis TaxID=2134037 RepID=A0ABW2NIZ0_9BACL|nr:GntR family transcriptional regulator [Bhargavaea sp. CC-171006]
MPINPESGIPIYLQIADWIEDGILTGFFEENEKVYSQYQLAEQYRINPATAAKGLSLLADQGILYKKRGLGMFVSPDARRIIFTRRRNGVLQEKIRDAVTEARLLGLSEVELISMLRDEMGGDK